MKPLYKHNQTAEVERWRLLSATARQAILQAAVPDLLAQLPNNQHEMAQRVFAHVLNHAQALDKVLVLEGATGESNELRHTARGKALVVGLPLAQTSSNFVLLLMAQTLSALLAGCEVIVRCFENPRLTDAIRLALTKAGVSADVISTANDADLTTLLQMSGLAVVGLVGQQAEVRQVARTLANTDGILTQIVPITDLKGGKEVFANDFVYQYSTERVRTVNTTAIGGNASLIELGMG